jgi:hypothetical protein
VAVTLTGLTCNTTYHFRVTATNSIDTVHGNDQTFTTSACTLTVTITGNGSGTITSSPQGTNPVGITCTSGTCSTTFTAGTVVELLKDIDVASTLEKWEGDCTGNGTCQLTMNGTRNVTATISLVPKIKNVSIGKTYSTLAIAIGEALTGNEINLLESEITESVTLSKALIFKGGWYNAYQAQGGLFTTLNGNFTIQSGASSAEKLAIKGKLEIQTGSLLANGVTVK